MVKDHTFLSPTQNWPVTENLGKYGFMEVSTLMVHHGSDGDDIH